SWHPHTERPRLLAVDGAVLAEHPELEAMVLHVEGDRELLFCENESNARRLWDEENATRYVKDGIDDRIVHGRGDAVNPARTGTKAAVHVPLVVPPGWTATVRARLGPKSVAAPFQGFDALVDARRAEADEFYEAITPPAVDAERGKVMRQALAG